MTVQFLILGKVELFRNAIVEVIANIKRSCAFWVLIAVRKHGRDREVPYHGAVILSRKHT